MLSAQPDVRSTAMANSRWGKVFKIVTETVFDTPQALVVVGAVSAIKGEGFIEGIKNLDSIADSAAEAAGEFGDKHAQELTNAAKFVGKTVANAVIGHIVKIEIFDR